VRGMITVPATNSYRPPAVALVRRPRRTEARPLVDLSDSQSAELSDFRPALTTPLADFIGGWAVRRESAVATGPSSNRLVHRGWRCARVARRGEVGESNIRETAFLAKLLNRRHICGDWHFNGRPICPQIGHAAATTIRLTRLRFACHLRLHLF